MKINTYGMISSLQKYIYIYTIVIKNKEENRRKTKKETELIFDIRIRLIKRRFYLQ